MENWSCFLRTKAGEMTPDGAEAAQAAVRNGNYRVPLAAGVVGGRSADRDLLCRDEPTAGLGHHEGAGERQQGQCDLNQKIYCNINEWRERPLVGGLP
jgi:hypothetical protein